MTMSAGERSRWKLLEDQIMRMWTHRCIGAGRLTIAAMPWWTGPWIWLKAGNTVVVAAAAAAEDYSRRDASSSDGGSGFLFD